MKVYFLVLAVLLLSPFEARAASDAPVACPMIAKLCPDGSSVSPQGPKCEIPACPGGDAKIQSPEPEPPEADDCDDDDCDDKPTDPNND
jgi:hypothetical protein